ncbi:hypothetical protein HPB47_012593 [Ixodes persulcatus]|uniref:Uncharacterized protein n=1 Tax=Ixodes persulcatus TaxID=34615 RepID=A0AC60NT75_IXOPE|nr:hypothetical protein HPB47_012593 [Ixodes persulcatus]
MEETLQRVAETVHEFAKSCGLSCSPQKSELLVIKPRRKKGEQENVRITIDGTNITPTTQARILGVIFQNNGKAGASIDKIKVSTEQISNMIRRVTNRRRGLKEDDALTLVQAFVTSRIVYAAPYLKLLKKDRDQLNVIIRKATKMALGMPRHSSTNKLLGMAKHNVVEELIKAHLSNQRVRLSQTSAGGRVLARLGLQEANRKETGPLPRLWAQKIDRSFQHPYLQNKMYPERYKKECNFCKNQLGTLQHVVGVCDFVKPIPPPLTIPTTPSHPSSSLTERWETLLTSPVLEDQLVLISRGQAAREAYGSRDEGTTSIDGV